jgi:predicted dehydrogenase
MKRRTTRDRLRTTPRRIRYAVVGLGHIAQVAALPAFAHAHENSELVALVSDDEEKRRKKRKSAATAGQPIDHGRRRSRARGGR